MFKYLLIGLMLVGLNQQVMAKEDIHICARYAHDLWTESWSKPYSLDGILFNGSEISRILGEHTHKFDNDKFIAFHQIGENQVQDITIVKLVDNHFSYMETLAMEKNGKTWLIRKDTSKKFGIGSDC